MENASKAMIIAGSILITIMIIAVAAFIFQRGQEFSDSASLRSGDVEVQSFNSQFSGFETLWEHGNTISDETRYFASSSLNKISDVISAANLAVSVNSQNNYGYSFVENRNGYVETENAVEIIIDMASNTPNGLNKYYIIEPNQNVNANCVYGTNNLDTTISNDARNSRISRFSTSFNSFNETNCNDLLRLLNETKLVRYNNSNYTLYKYYFEGEYHVNSRTQKIDTVKFTLVYDAGFDSL